MKNFYKYDVDFNQQETAYLQSIQDNIVVVQTASPSEATTPEPRNPILPDWLRKQLKLDSGVYMAYA